MTNKKMNFSRLALIPLKWVSLVLVADLVLSLLNGQFKIHLPVLYLVTFSFGIIEIAYVLLRKKP